jgi:hypothetical protein
MVAAARPGSVHRRYGLELADAAFEELWVKMDKGCKVMQCSVFPCVPARPHAYPQYGLPLVLASPVCHPQYRSDGRNA